MNRKVTLILNPVRNSFTSSSPPSGVPHGPPRRGWREVKEGHGPSYDTKRDGYHLRTVHVPSISSPCPPVGSAPFTPLTSLRSAEPDGGNDVRSERKTVNDDRGKGRSRASSSHRSVSHPVCSMDSVNLPFHPLISTSIGFTYRFHPSSRSNQGIT